MIKSFFSHAINRLNRLISTKLFPANKLRNAETDPCCFVPKNITFIIVNKRNEAHHMEG